jgi:enamine deaminase RidA (YjgF/YER057c/UK114 family)
MTDLANFNAFDEVWKEYFEVPPARTTIGTTGLLVPGTLVEIDLTADSGKIAKAIPGS